MGEWYNLLFVLLECVLLRRRHHGRCCADADLAKAHLLSRGREQSRHDELRAPGPGRASPAGSAESGAPGDAPAARGRAEGEASSAWDAAAHRDRRRKYRGAPLHPTAAAVADLDVGGYRGRGGEHLVDVSHGGIARQHPAGVGGTGHGLCL